MYRLICVTSVRIGQEECVDSRDRSKVYKWLAVEGCLGEEVAGHRDPPTMRPVSIVAFDKRLRDIRIPSRLCFHRNPNLHAEFREPILEG